jgi:ABC-type molybdenum transport system ATPase subunit/photorepair protein PhrA
MSRVDLTLQVDIERTPRVIQLEGMFDVPEAKLRTVDFHFDVPLDDQEWRIGLITGPSGAGKSSVARHLFPDAIVDAYEWPENRSVIDAFGEMSIRDSTAALSVVGFSSPPSWTKPYRILSTGEKFRANLARAIVDERDLIVFDEFTSVVDRTVAKVASYAVAKAVRKHPTKRFVAVSCHDDIVDWLQPDWILEPHVGCFRWRSLQRRPELELTIVRCEHSAWFWFAPHHYLTAQLQRNARCFVGMIEGKPAAFAGLIYFPYPKRKFQSLSRLVVLPDYQGLGLGAYAFTETIAKIVKANEYEFIAPSAHPALINAWAKSKLWKMTSKPHFLQATGKNSAYKGKRRINPRHVFGRRIAHFRYIGPGFIDSNEIAAAQKLWRNA